MAERFQPSTPARYDRLVSYARRQARIVALEAIERRVKQFRSHENLFPFRVPHEPLDLHALLDDALAETGLRVELASLKSRSIIRLEWRSTVWEAWAITLASGVHVFCDTIEDESRVLASLKRGNPLEADRFFLELLAETRGEAFGIEMAGGPPDRVRTPITDREFLADVFVDLYEGAVSLDGAFGAPRSTDFRDDVRAWLSHALIAPPEVKSKRIRRFRETDDSVI